MEKSKMERMKYSNCDRKDKLAKFVLRLLSDHTNLSMRKLVSGSLKADEWARLGDAVRKIENFKIECRDIYDNAG
jgi:replicative DNA helicase